MVIQQYLVEKKNDLKVIEADSEYDALWEKFFRKK